MSQKFKTPKVTSYGRYPKLVVSDTEYSDYSPNVNGIKAYSGRVYNHPNSLFQDGCRIVTAEVLSRDGDVVRTHESTFRLVRQSSL